MGECCDWECEADEVNVAGVEFTPSPTKNGNRDMGGLPNDITAIYTSRMKTTAATTTTTHKAYTLDSVRFH